MSFFIFENFSSKIFKYKKRTWSTFNALKRDQTKRRKEFKFGALHISDFNTKNLIVIRKNQNIAKKHSVVIIVLKNCEKKWFLCNLKFFPSYLGWKKSISKTFQSLGLDFKNLFLDALFSTLVTWKNLQITLEVWTIFSQFFRTIMTT